MRRAVRLTLAAVVVTTCARPARGDPPTKEQCVVANESAQELRQQDKLRDAHAKLRACIAKSCPGPVRDDCQERLAEVERAMPTVTFEAKSVDGSVLQDVLVTMDGAWLTDRLDGSPLMVDPGEHWFRFEVDHFVSTSLRLDLTEGVKGRKEEVTLAPAARPDASNEPPAIATAGSSAPAPRPASGDDPKVTTTTSDTFATSGMDRRPIAYALGGAGLVGLIVGTYFGIRAKVTYDRQIALYCPSGAGACHQAGVDGIEDAYTQATVSTVAFVTSGALFAGGIVVYLTAPTHGVRVAPGAGTSRVGVRVLGTF